MYKLQITDLTVIGSKQALGFFFKASKHLPKTFARHLPRTGDLQLQVTIITLTGLLTGLDQSLLRQGWNEFCLRQEWQFFFWPAQSTPQFSSEPNDEWGVMTIFVKRQSGVAKQYKLLQRVISLFEGISIPCLSLKQKQPIGHN